MAFLGLLEHQVSLVSLAYKDSWASQVILVLLALLGFLALLDSLAHKVLLEHLDCKDGQVMFHIHHLFAGKIAYMISKEFSY